VQKAEETGNTPNTKAMDASTSREDQETDELGTQMLGTLDSTPADEPAGEAGALLEFEAMPESMKSAEPASGGSGALKSRSGRSRSSNEADFAPTVRGQLNLGQAKSTAEDDKIDAITSAINAKKSRIKQCYEIELRNNPSLAGQVTISFEVLRGRVLESEIIKNTTGNLNLAKCIQSRIDQLTFSKEVEASVEYPFVFTPSR